MCMDLQWAAVFPPSYNWTCSLKPSVVFVLVVPWTLGDIWFDQCSKLGKKKVQTQPCVSEGGGGGGVFFLFFSPFFDIFFLQTAPLQVFSSSFLTSACIIAAIVFVLSDHSNVSLVNTFFLFSIFLYFLHFVSLVCCIFPCPCPSKKKKRKKKNCPLLLWLVGICVLTAFYLEPVQMRILFFLF